MIRIRLNNCIICRKQREFLHGLDNLQNLLSIGAISRFIFCKSKLQSRQKGRVAMQIDSCSTSSEISFHRLPSKSKRPIIRKQIASSLSSQLTVSLFLRNSNLQTDIWQTCFCQYFCKPLQNSCSASKKRSEIFQKVKKKPPLVKSYFSKVVAFYRSSHPR